MGPRELQREYLRWAARSKRAGERIGVTASGKRPSATSGALCHHGLPCRRAAGLGLRRRGLSRPSPVAHLRAPRASQACRCRPGIRAHRDRRGRSGVGSAARAARVGDAYRPLLALGELVLRVTGAGRAGDWPVEERHEFNVRPAADSSAAGTAAGDPPPRPSRAVCVSTTWSARGGAGVVRPPGPAVHPALNRLIGEVELPHVTVTLNESDVERAARSGSRRTRCTFGPPAYAGTDRL